MVVQVHHLAGAAEIGRMLGGLSRQRVQQLISRPDFPKPAVVLDMGKVWKREDVIAWAKAHGRDVVAETSAGLAEHQDAPPPPVQAGGARTAIRNLPPMR